MKPDTEHLSPMEIERRSFEIISRELDRALDPQLAPIIQRVIHTTADFEYADTLYFSPNVVSKALEALQKELTLITDTTMALAGINKRSLAALGVRACCLIADHEVARAAKANNTTRSKEAMIKAAEIAGPKAFVIGNAPTALIQLHQMIEDKVVQPAFIIGVPVGFVNVVQSKERIKETDVPCILSMGRKGGSNVAAAIVNALLYMLVRKN